MRRFVFLLALLASGVAASGAAAQEAPPDTARVYVATGEPPALVGGPAALAARVAYPPEAAEAGVQGRVYVEMIVERDGTTSDPVCVRAPSPELCGAALVAVAASPFTPGRLQGTAVRTRHVVNVDFRLADPDPPEASGERPAPLAPGATLGSREPVETNPVLIGGIAGLQRRVEYPEKARREGVQGRVFVQFVVGSDGQVRSLTCPRSPDPRLCEAAKAAVRGSEWTPGTQNGRPVDIRFTLPVDFRLR